MAWKKPLFKPRKNCLRGQKSENQPNQGVTVIKIKEYSRWIHRYIFFSQIPKSMAHQIQSNGLFRPVWPPFTCNLFRHFRLYWDSFLKKWIIHLWWTQSWNCNTNRLHLLLQDTWNCHLFSLLVKAKVFFDRERCD